MSLSLYQDEVRKLVEHKYGKGSRPAATFKKLLEEIGELGEAMMGRGNDHSDQHLKEEAGDTLFVFFNLLTHLGIDANKLAYNSLMKIHRRWLGDSEKSPAQSDRGSDKVEELEPLK